MRSWLWRLFVYSCLTHALPNLCTHVTIPDGLAEIEALAKEAEEKAAESGDHVAWVPSACVCTRSSSLDCCLPPVDDEVHEL